jgi:hypothetical protein
MANRRKKKLMAVQNKRTLVAVAAALLMFWAVHASAADLPARLLVDPSEATQIERDAFERGAIVIFGSRTYDPATGQPFNVQILEGGSAPPVSPGQGASGRCFSACVYAYIGGSSRYMTAGDSLGIHRFTAASPSEHDLEHAQLVSGELARYISDMGVDVRLFQIASQVPSASVYRLTLKDAIALRVANNGHPTRDRKG